MGNDPYAMAFAIFRQNFNFNRLYQISDVHTREGPPVFPPNNAAIGVDFSKKSE